MQIVAAIGGLAFVLASLVVGLRLMYLGWRNHGLAEWVLGAGLFFMGGVSYPLTIVAHEAHGLDMGARVALLMAHVVCNTAGMTGIAWFTRRVFRPDAGWAAGLVLATFAAYTGAFLMQTFGPGWAAFADQADGPWLYSQVGAMLAPVWAGTESLLYHGQMRKRMKLGLADAVLTDRFRLWGLAMGIAAAITVLSRVLNELGIPTVGTVAGAIVVGPPGVAIAASLWLAFFPPGAYVRRIEARAAAAASSA